MPFVTVQMLSGRTDDQKKALIEKVNAAVAETTNASPESIHVIIQEMERTNYGVAGKRLSD